MSDTFVIECFEQPAKLNLGPQIHPCPLCGRLFVAPHGKATSYTDANTGNVYSLLCGDCAEQARKIKCGAIEIGWKIL